MLIALSTWHQPVSNMSPVCTDWLLSCCLYLHLIISGTGYPEHFAARSLPPSCSPATAVIWSNLPVLTFPPSVQSPSQHIYQHSSSDFPAFLFASCSRCQLVYFFGLCLLPEPLGLTDFLYLDLCLHSWILSLYRPQSVCLACFCSPGFCWTQGLDIDKDTSSLPLRFYSENVSFVTSLNQLSL